jgi:CDP-diacylglycerol--glycerol-3-phosphate 3-phosphatidyltransferase
MGIQRGDFIKNLQNKITIMRIVCSVFIVLPKPFTLLFWILYIVCGISDILDGFVARSMKQESEFGAKLDSIADIIFISSVTIVLIPIIKIPLWIWICVVVVIFIRILSYLVGLKKFCTFTSLHTYSNKLTGLLLFVIPVFYVIFNFNITAIVLSISAILSSVEELIIIISTKELNENCKSIFNI